MFVGSRDTKYDKKRGAWCWEVCFTWRIWLGQSTCFCRWVSPLVSVQRNCVCREYECSCGNTEYPQPQEFVVQRHYLLSYCYYILGVTSSKSVKKGAATRGDWVIGKDEAFYLYSLGPNYNSIGHLHTDFTLLSKDLDGYVTVLQLINRWCTAHISHNITLTFLFSFPSSSQPFLVASRLWSRLSITERSVSAELSTGFLRSPHVVIPDLEMSLKVNAFIEPIAAPDTTPSHAGVSPSVLYVLSITRTLTILHSTVCDGEY